MSDINPYFMDPCELIAIVYGSDGITKLGRYSFQGYMRGINLFSQICSLFAREMAHSNPEGKESDFEIYLSTIRDYYHAYIKNGEIDSMERALQQNIDDLKQYRFKAQRIFPTLPQSSATSLNYRQFEITIDFIFKGILEMRQERIIFYERILQEYKAQKDQYDRQLRAYLENEGKNSVRESLEFSVDSVLSELGFNSEVESKGHLPKIYYKISNQSWYLKDLEKLDNLEIERYTKKYKELPRYRINRLHAHPEGLRVFFELFSVFKDEMCLILPDNPSVSFFERVLTVLIRDFIDEFEQRGNLDDIIIKYIEELEKFEFFSLSKEQFFNKLSKMIYSLRTHRIEVYETVLEDYLANREEYNNAM